MAVRPTSPSHHKPFVWSPWSFFFWDRPVLLALDQEKNAPFRRLSLSSSPASSFRDRPDLDFPLSCHQRESRVMAEFRHGNMARSAAGSGVGL